MSREWTVVISGDWHLPHLVNMLAAYHGNSEQNECRDEVIGQVKAQMVPAVDGGAMTTRPLVVIDPDDADEVLRLCDAYASVDNRVGVTPMQRALREFADPKPMEVFEHFLINGTRDDEGVVRSVCGKVWTPSDNTVAERRCPTCAAIVDKGWTK